MFIQEWKQIFKNKMLMIVLAAVVVIPSIYTILFLGSMWDPYGKLENLPVAVVNLDKPVEYEEKTLQVGADLTKKLRDNEELDFHFVEGNEAKKGLENGSYYMVITIPENFSKNATTLMEEHPQKMQLDYSTNPASNYIASKMSETAFSKIKTQVAKEVTKTYTETVFEQLTTIADGMDDGAEGAEKLGDGVNKLKNGNKKIKDNLQVLAESCITFKNGGEELQVGLKEYTDGVAKVANGSKALEEGSTKLAKGSEKLNGGTKTLSKGINSLASGTDTLQKSTGSLTTGTAALNKGATALNTGANTLYTGTSTYVTGSTGLALGVQSYVGGVEQIKTGANQLSGLKNLGQVSDGITALSSAVSQNTEESTSLISATSQLSVGLQSIKDQVDQTTSSLQTKNLMKLQAGLGQAATGISDAASGISSAADTIGQATNAIKGANSALSSGLDAVNQQVEANNKKLSATTESINKEIEKANKEISSQGEIAKETINQQIESAIAIIDSYVETGVITHSTATAMENNLKAVMVETAVRGNVALVDEQNIKLNAVVVPEQVSTTVAEANAGLDKAKDGLQEGAKSLSSGAEKLRTMGSSIPSQVNTDSFTQLSSALGTATNGAKGIEEGTKKVSAALTTLELGTKDFKTAGTGMGSLISGINQLSENNTVLSSGAQQLIDNGSSLTTGAKSVWDGASSLATGASTLDAGAIALSDGITKVNAGAGKLKKGSTSLKNGMKTLDAGLGSLNEGASTLKEGTNTLVSNNEKLLNGADALAEGAGKISDGAGKLSDGAEKLQSGIEKISDGSEELSSALSDGAEDVRASKASDTSIDMFAEPIDGNETKITNMPNNGHAMSAYMMSVGLWVGCLAFCLVYPLTKYKGKLKNGFAWWASKASVLAIISTAMGVVMITLLHLSNGFEPAAYGKTVLVAIMAGWAFMSIMYFFDVLLGKVGSFLMLIFMVIQLAGSAGTYPVEISGGFVAKIHNYLPFTYTVNAFRNTIAGTGSIAETAEVLLGITVVFSLFTMLMFIVKSIKIKNNKPMLEDFLEENGLA